MSYSVIKADQSAKLFQKAEHEKIHLEAELERLKEIEKLIHHKDTTVGLWAADIEVTELWNKYKEVFPEADSHLEAGGLHAVETVGDFLRWIKEQIFFQIEY